MEYKYDREYWNEVNGLVWKQVKRCGLTLARTALVLLVFVTTLPWQLFYYMHDRWLDYKLERAEMLAEEEDRRRRFENFVEKMG